LREVVLRGLHVKLVKVPAGENVLNKKSRAQDHHGRASVRLKHLSGNTGMPVLKVCPISKKQPNRLRVVRPQNEELG
jgi:hypothetical protein